MATEGYVTTDDGVQLYFRRIGNGQRTVLIPNGFHLIDDFARLANQRKLVVYDVRSRGRSDWVTGTDKMRRGIHHDVDDMEAVRRCCGDERVDAIGHSYVGVTVVLYAM